VLPIALGPATRLLPYLSGDKTYRGVIQLGVRTDSDDLDGEVLDRQPVPALLEPELEAALNRFRGTIQQRPPAVSAVHVNGERAYKLARAGVALDLPARSVSVHRLTLLSWWPDLGQLELEVACSAGTYIRSLARDLGDGLGCGGALARLRRTEALGFGLQQSVSLEQLDQEPRPLLVDPLDALAHLPRHPLEHEQLQGWRCGRLQECDPSWPADTAVVVVSPDGNLAGMARVQAIGALQPRLVLDAAG
jgi:tRNA pseudouridine55 synthase